MQPKVVIQKKSDILYWKCNTIFFYITLFIGFFLLYQLYDVQRIKKEILTEKINNEIDMRYKIKYASVVVDKLKDMVFEEYDINQKMIIHSPYFQMEQFFNIYYPKMNEVIKEKYINLIVESSLEYNIPPLLMASLFKRESNFDPKATGSVLPSGVRARGLGQVLWKWHKDKVIKRGYNNIKDLYKPEVNIPVSTEILKEFYDRNKGNIVKALTGYVGGHHQGYVNDIMTTYVNVNIYVYNMFNIDNIPVERDKLVFAHYNVNNS